MPRSDADGLPGEFYDRPVLEVARALIGCTLSYTAPGGAPAGAGVIVETEAYHESEPACHAFIGLTPRTQTLFGPPGLAYVYCSYGIHALFNAVCEPQGVGAAVLIRALQPLDGLEQMRARRAHKINRQDGAPRPSARSGALPACDTWLCSGPGKLTQALGFGLSENGGDLRRGPVRIHGPAQGWGNPSVVVGARVGITKAVELPWRFCLAGNANVSRPRPQVDGSSS